MPSPPRSKFSASKVPGMAIGVPENGAGGAGVVTDNAGVVTDKGADGADALPAASRAATVKVYGVLGGSPLRDADVLAAEATSALHDALPNSMPSPPRAKVSASRVPGMAIGVPENGAGGAGVVTDNAGVVTDKGADGADALPAASRAATV